LNIQNRIKKEARLQVRALGKADSIQKTWFRNFVGQTLFYNFLYPIFFLTGLENYEKPRKLLRKRFSSLHIRTSQELSETVTI
jgi:hypothetical protein